MAKLAVSMKSPRVIYGLAMLIVFGIALFLRIYFQYDSVFTDGWVRFHENDPWYHMRQIENLSYHFPHINTFDPYGFYPGGQNVGSAPFFDLLVGFFIWVIGLGSPSRQVIEAVGAFFPAIMGALITVPVYFIGKELFNRKAGLIAAALIAILPGQFLWRTLLGFTDHHVAEIFFSALALMFLIIAINRAKEREISFDTLKRRDWTTLRKPLLYSLLAGIALGFYLLSWIGGALLIFIIFVYYVIQFISDHLRNRSTNYLCLTGVAMFIIALLMVAPAAFGSPAASLQLKALLIGMAAFLVLGALSFLMAERNIRQVYYLLVIAVLGGIGFIIFYFAVPSLAKSILNQFSVFTPVGGYLTVAEMKGLSLSSTWDQFSTGFYLAIISMAVIAYYAVREGAPDKTLLLVWSLIILIATFGQNRFAYYFAVNVAVLTAYVSWRILEFAGLKERYAEVKKEEKAVKAAEQVKLSKKARRKQAKAARGKQKMPATKVGGPVYIFVTLAIIIVFFLAFFPNIGLAIDRAKGATGATDDWHESLSWMRENTPEPFQNPDFYYELYDKPPGESFEYPESAYGVMSWWDYGYWITYIAHRIPNASPSGQAGARNAGELFTAQDELSAIEVLDKLGSRYIVIDYPMATSKFYAMTIWAGNGSSEFFDVYYQRTDQGELQGVMLYYPEYYQSICARLYNFGGEEWDPDKWIINNPKDKIVAMSYVLRTDAGGTKYREITSVKQFTSYPTAKAFVDAEPDYIIVGANPFISPVPLEKLEHFKLIHQSPSSAATRGNDKISIVEIFEYAP